MNGPADFRKETEMSQACVEKLAIYEKRLIDWNVNINLVADSTIPHIWQRHFFDSAQLFPLIPEEATSIADIGSGAGFPGMVLAIMAADAKRPLKVTLIEKNTRKASFLRTVAAETGTAVEVVNLDILAAKGTYDVITARALAPVGELLALSARLRKPSTLCLFLKGKNLDRELFEAQKDWVADVRKMPSTTDSEGVIARLSHIKPVGLII